MIPMFWVSQLLSLPQSMYHHYFGFANWKMMFQVSLATLVVLLGFGI